MIAALERKHALAARILAHELQRVLDRLRAADIEVDAALHPERPLDALAEHRRELDLFAVQVLAGELRQADRSGLEAPQ